MDKSADNSVQNGYFLAILFSANWEDGKMGI